MNRGSIRAAVEQQADWNSSSSDESKEIVNGFINRAQDQVALDAPYMAFEGTFYLQTQEDVAPTRTDDTLTFAEEDSGSGFQPVSPYVLGAVLPIGTAEAVVWKIDRTWDGRMIEIEDSNGVKRTNRIRAVWKESVGDDEYFKLSLWRPWNLSQWGEGPFRTWRVYTNEYYLPDEVIEIKSMRVIKEDVPTTIKVLNQNDAEDMGIAEHTTAVTATSSWPVMAFRRKHEQMRGPSVAPTVSEGTPASAGGRWQGPEPAGSFRYMVTYCMGKRPQDYANPGLPHWQGDADPFLSDFDYVDLMGLDNRVYPGQARIMEPIIESAPSPASELIELESDAGTLLTPNVYVQLPNIEYALGFIMQGTQWTGASSDGFNRQHSYKSGVYVRVYRQRVSADLGTGYTGLGVDASPGGRNIYGLANLDFDDGYYLLAEVKIDQQNAGIFIDDGSLIPDYHRRLRDIHGYQSVKFHPRPQDTYEVEIRALRRPSELVSDYDVPVVHAEACDLIVYKTLEYLYERMGQPQKKLDAQNEYNRLLGQHAKRYGTAVPSSQVIRTRPARASRR